jgi:hydroxyacyl-ACP dehydratase HTD2-like protein with hotdog domain
MTASVAVGESLGVIERSPTRVGLFLFGVAHWTAHRIHYDPDWARHEGFPEVLVTAQLMSAWQIQLVAEWAGPTGTLMRLTERNVSPAFAGEKLTIGGEVTAVRPEGDHTMIDCALRVTIGDRAVVESVAVVRRCV